MEKVNTKVTLFEEKRIRRVWHEEEWYFAVVDVIEVLTDSPLPRQYWTKVKKKLGEEGQLYPIWIQLKMEAADGKKYATDCANTEALFRIIMSVSSPKAEPFRLWLAKIGKERLEEIENPELAADRAKELYRAKGYPDEWIDKRLKSIEVRQQLTDEWKGRGVQEGQEYAILTAEIAKATFGLTPTEHKTVKGLERENLRDHMTNLELIFTMLGEESTRRFAVDRDSQGFPQNQAAARDGGGVAGKAREEFETRGNEKVVSETNFKNQLKPSAKPKPVDENLPK